MIAPSACGRRIPSTLRSDSRPCPTPSWSDLAAAGAEPRAGLCAEWARYSGGGAGRASWSLSYRLLEKPLPDHNHCVKARSLMWCRGVGCRVGGDAARGRALAGGARGKQAERTQRRSSAFQEPSKSLPRAFHESSDFFRRAFPKPSPNFPRAFAKRVRRCGAARLSVARLVASPSPPFRWS